MPTNKENKDEFVKLLRSTEREGVDDVIAELEELGFFEAPASSTQHLNTEGGLLQHSLNVCYCALKIREQMMQFDESIAKEVPEDRVIIASLLHDVCKADIYRKVQRARRNEVGQYEKYDEYQVDYSNFPLGHGEKSVVMLLRSGLGLEDEELMAIRWHMGAWDLATNSYEQERSYRAACSKTPLVALIHTADTISAQILEAPVETVQQ